MADYSAEDYAYAESLGLFDSPADTYGDGRFYSNNDRFSQLLGAATVIVPAVLNKGGTAQDTQRAQLAQRQAAAGTPGNNPLLLIGAAVLGLVLVVLMVRRA